MTYKAKQGDIIYLDFNPQKGREQRERRPAIIVSNNFFNQLSNLALVCPISNVNSDFPLNVILDKHTKTKGSVLCQHLKSLDLFERNASFIERIPDHLMQEVLNIIHSEF
ncbi:Endoribonuclease MazF [Lentibacillus sp. JNUCC-1]|uniref:type II toxin-antitoxin system PemK/MazF family toxin n=1 Tax=Lentibacillus sp. JNUCC-1 TaxID=2654513 RepID=UPI0012E7424E|nr:type II toxin-antitoxin system PemK/MazF family toxin [Lentibacillus sp. JNUCC-1]MUV38874.1 Endoribonuclease MazF [Lentibacillus sp. JNUCC-1]